MPLSRIVQNVGVGKVEATFVNLTTTYAPKQATPFTQALVDLYRRACTIVGNNQVAHGTTTAALFGSVIATSLDNMRSGKEFPSRLVVQSHGFAEMQGTTGAAAPSAALGAVRRPMQNRAFVVQGTTAPAAAERLCTRGIITEVYNTDRCVVCF